MELRSLGQMIVEPDAKLIDYETRRTKGNNLPGMEVLNEQRRNRPAAFSSEGVGCAAARPVLHIVRYVVKN